MKDLLKFTVIAVCLIFMLALTGCGGESEAEQDTSKAAPQSLENRDSPIGPSDDHAATAEAYVRAATSEDESSVLVFQRPIQLARMAEGMGSLYRHMTGNGKDAFVKYAETVTDDKAAAYDKIVTLLDEYKVNKHGQLPAEADNLAFLQGIHKITGGIERNRLAGAETVSLSPDESTLGGGTVAYDVKLKTDGGVRDYRLLLKKEEGLWYAYSFGEDKRGPRTKPDAESRNQADAAVEVEE